VADHRLGYRLRRSIASSSEYRNKTIRSNQIDGVSDPLLVRRTVGGVQLADMTDDWKQPPPADPHADRDEQPNPEQRDGVTDESVQAPAMAPLINNTGDDADGAATG